MDHKANDFGVLFKELTTNAPLSWQDRLFRDHFVKNDLPSAIDIPTGLGKTMVMAIWLIARQFNPALPRRLIYVVDRRTVVDQATDLATKLVKTCHDGGNSKCDPPVISTLRGQLADNREWSRDPSRPAIIIGTVDLIGSALLFSGYRSSFKRRPLEAGLLAQDSLLVLDEAHLSKPFEKLLGAIETFNSRSGGGDATSSPMRVIRMSATSGEAADANRAFSLTIDADGNLEGEDANETIRGRFEASKRLTFHVLGENEKLVERMARCAVELATNPGLKGKRIVVFVRKPDDAKAIGKLIREHTVETVDETGSKPKKSKHSPYAGAVEVLTGTMRGLERDQLVEKPVFKSRWFHGELSPDSTENQAPVFLVSTSAGEVGFDLNADHLVGDEAPLDSWIQRLGRVNRRGAGDATVVLIRRHEAASKTDFDKACGATSTLLTNGMDVSPKALGRLKKTLTMEVIEEASTPRPSTVELTDILLDSWSMTSIVKPMPGRPEVGPWLRGIDEEMPQTTIAWRAELDLYKADPDPTKALQKIFAKHSIRPHESITINTGQALEFLKQACKLKDRPEDLPKIRVVIRLPRGDIMLATIEELIESPGVLFSEPTLILPASFGGLDSAGMLDAESIPKRSKDGAPPTKSLDVADHPDYKRRADDSPRLRLLIRRTDDETWIPESLPHGHSISGRLKLDSEYPKSSVLFDDLRKNKYRVRLVQPITSDDDGDAIRSIVFLFPPSNKNKPEDQSLDDHVGAVEFEAERIADALELAASDPIRIALLFAARWHDEGKKAPIWQRFVYGSDANGQFKGKSSKTRDPKSLLGYRHEFGSLLRIHHADRHGTHVDDLPSDADARELALHLIATHHGMGRPHFPSAIYHDFSDVERDSIQLETIRRFARLQRKYGWWRLAWLENLLRCADAIASADDEAEDDPTDAEGAEG